MLVPLAAPGHSVSFAAVRRELLKTLGKHRKTTSNCSGRTVMTCDVQYCDTIHYRVAGIPQVFCCIESRRIGRGNYCSWTHLTQEKVGKKKGTGRLLGCPVGTREPPQAGSRSTAKLTRRQSQFSHRWFALVPAGARVSLQLFVLSCSSVGSIRLPLRPWLTPRGNPAEFRRRWLEGTKRYNYIICTQICGDA
jgi:hypothetical protein